MPGGGARAFPPKPSTTGRPSPHPTGSTGSIPGGTFRRGTNTATSASGSGRRSRSGAGCAADPETTEPYRHNRYDYWRLRDRFPDLFEPNYLPFMTYRVSPPAPGGVAGIPRRVGGALGIEAPGFHVDDHG